MELNRVPGKQEQNSIGCWAGSQLATLLKPTPLVVQFDQVVYCKHGQKGLLVM